MLRGPMGIGAHALPAVIAALALPFRRFSQAKHHKLLVGVPPLVLHRPLHATGDSEAQLPVEPPRMSIEEETSRAQCSSSSASEKSTESQKIVRSKEAPCWPIGISRRD